MKKLNPAEQKDVLTEILFDRADDLEVTPKVKKAYSSVVQMLLSDDGKVMFKTVLDNSQYGVQVYDTATGMMITTAKDCVNKTVALDYTRSLYDGYNLQNLVLEI